LSAVRRAGPADVPAIAAIHVAAWRDTYAGILPQEVIDRFDLARRTAQWTPVAGTPDHPVHLLVSTDTAGAPTGFGSCGPVRDGGPPGALGEIMTLYVALAARGRGTGRVLMDRMLDDLRVRSLMPAFLCVLDGNHGAIRFYRQVGGRHVGETATTVGGHPCREHLFVWDT